MIEMVKQTAIPLTASKAQSRGDDKQTHKNHDTQHTTNRGVANTPIAQEIDG
jgi:hypothetical protein